MNIEPRQILIGLSVYYQGDWNRIYGALKRHDYPPDVDLSALCASVKSKTLVLFDEDYPNYLRHGCIRPPFVLFYYGDISLLSDQQRILTVVGPRNPSEYAKSKTRELCREMVKRDYVLLSGLAYGIDTVAAEEGTLSPGHAIAVMGNGIDMVYPLENTSLAKKVASTGLLISEYPGLTSPDSRHFPMRNRILASIGRATFASEVGPHSGTAITVSYSLQMGRDIGVLPFRAGEGFCNNDFIKGGAALIETPEDLVLMMEGRLHF